MNVYSICTGSSEEEASEDAHPACINEIDHRDIVRLSKPDETFIMIRRIYDFTSDSYYELGELELIAEELRRLKNAMPNNSSIDSLLGKIGLSRMFNKNVYLFCS